jgi:hypothetical protein
MKTVRLLRSFLTHIARVMEQGFLAFFRFTEEDAIILASAYGYHPPKIDHLQDSPDNENEEDADTPRRVRRHSRLAPGSGQILLGVPPELASVSFSTASRKHLRRQREV